MIFSSSFSCETKPSRYRSFSLCVLLTAAATGRLTAQTNTPDVEGLTQQRGAEAAGAAAEAQATFESTNAANSVSGAVSVQEVVTQALPAPAALARAGLPQEIESVPSGGIARFGPHQVAFANDLNTIGAVDLMMPDQQELRSHIQGLMYYIPNGPSVVIAVIKSCQGQIVSSNQVMYPAAFDSVSADVLYTYTATSLEQDIILRAQLPSPENWGLDPAQARLAVITVFIDPPQPNVRADPTDLSDELISFNTMRIAKGRAFLLGDTGTEIPVVKNWTSFNLDGRWFLVESTPFTLLESPLQTLPPGTGSIGPGNSRAFRSFRTALLSLPRQSSGPGGQAALSPNRPSSAGVTDRGTNHTAGLLPGRMPHAPGLVLDYLIASTPLLNVQFGSVSNEVGLAAIGETTNDYWTLYNFPNATNVTLTNLYWSDGSTNGVNLTVTNAPGQGTNPVSDNMLAGYVYKAGGNLGLTLTNIPNGSYDFFLYGHGPVTNQNGVFQLTSGTNVYGAESTTTVGTNSFSSTNWQEGIQYIVFRNVPVVSNQVVSISVEQDAAGYAIVNGLQMVFDNPESIITSLIDVDFGDVNDLTFGSMAVSLSSSDDWDVVISKYTSGYTNATGVPWSDGFSSPVSVAISNAPGTWGEGITGFDQYNTYVYNSSLLTIPVTVSNLANGRYDFYLYGHGAANNQNSSFDLATGGTDYGTKSTASTGSYSWTSTNWVEGQQYIVFRDIWVTTNAPVIVTVDVDSPGYAIINCMQIALPMPSNNTDSNGDGIPDWWDLEWGFNPHDPTVATNDPAGDGISNLTKYQQGLNPYLAYQLPFQVQILRPANNSVVP
jgi:hypothetical protein